MFFLCLRVRVNENRDKIERGGWENYNENRKRRIVAIEEKRGGREIYKERERVNIRECRSSEAERQKT